jgi:hypothetical protein
MRCAKRIARLRALRLALERTRAACVTSCGASANVNVGEHRSPYWSGLTIGSRYASDNGGGGGID